ncbi:acyl carrier protein [Micromonospora sp. NPDC049051]|uniref:acyl carrier protein n=1 Tax=unclassified Micromonospora TaxID=2617518 RepID=UPI00371CF0C2
MDAPDRATVARELHDFIAPALSGPIGPDEDYFALGLLNSLFAIELVVFVEERFGLEVEVADLDLGHFRTISRLTDFVLAKLARRAGTTA